MDIDTTEKHENVIKSIDSLPNLRLVGIRNPAKQDLKQNSENCRAEFNGAIYRSSKPDRLTAGDIVHFRKLGIKTVVDFRSYDEYTKSDGTCLLDKEFSLYKVILPKKTYTSEDKVETKLIAKCDPTENNEDEKEHFLINFFSTSYVLQALRRVPWYIMFIGIFYALYDLFMKNKFKNFIEFFIKHSVNKGGITGQYKDVVDVSGSSICAAMKLISDPDKMPVLINCAHGKDRTGIMSALLLKCLGMSEDYILKDYALSEEGLASIQQIIYADMTEKLKLKPEFATAEEATMKELIDYIKKKHGTIEKYLCSIGFNQYDQQQLREYVVAFENKALMNMEGGRDITENGTNVDTKVKA